MTLDRNCEGVPRRDCLKLGLGALMGGSLASALELRAVAGTARKNATGCILIWLSGGPSHFETFDPKPNAPAEIRGEFQTIQSKVPGTVFSENMVRLAAIADKFAVVRSVKHNQNNHGAGNHYMMTGSPTRIPVSCSSASIPAWARSFRPSEVQRTGCHRISRFRRKLVREAPTSWGLGMHRLLWPMTRTPSHSRFVT